MASRYEQWPTPRLVSFAEDFGVRFRADNGVVFMSFAAFGERIDFELQNELRLRKAEIADLIRARLGCVLRQAQGERIPHRSLCADLPSLRVSEFTPLVVSQSNHEQLSTDDLRQAQGERVLVPLAVSFDFIPKHRDKFGPVEP